ncbi:hypothetical protein LUZ60_000482 [Juncus effusus]|nr:hypothetical protein LUZ60_000482 [Juncus effusus]
MEPTALLIALIQLCACITLSLSSTRDFVSIDCGANGSYTDAVTNISYSSDDQYIDTGKNYNIVSNNLNDSFSRQYKTVRSFPSGVRNCYKLNAVEGNKYLIRASFLYGNYDEQESSATSESQVSFDLYTGSNFWRRVDISEAYEEYSFELIYVALADLMWVCLIDTDRGTPFISTLEVRPLAKNLYPYAGEHTQIAILSRYNYGPTTGEIIRYPDDPYDRIWEPYSYNQTMWRELSTNETIANIDYSQSECMAPSAVFRTAVTPIHSRNLTVHQWDSEAISGPTSTIIFGYYVVPYLAELEKLSPNETRRFTFYSNGRGQVEGALPYLSARYDLAYISLDEDTHDVVTFSALENSTFPPLINGLEIFKLLYLKNPLTHIDDIHAIIDIKENYQLKSNWMGDPCTPAEYAWFGLLCNYNTTPPRIISLNLSYSGLTGRISDSFQMLHELHYLDLSYNNLTEEIPTFLGLIQSLQILSLEGNNFTGQVPDNLLHKRNEGFLILDVNESQLACADGNTCKRRKLSTFVIATILLGSMVLLLILLVFIITWWSKKTGMQINNSNEQFGEDSSNQLMDSQGNILQIECQQFTHAELQKITTKFSQIIGRGGFGTVYHGRLDNSWQVAVKVLSISSNQGNREFHAEVRHLSRVHHRNLLSLVGYCKDGTFMALVYDYMSGGNLQDYIRGKGTRILNMKERIQILLEASQGLEYLHTACEPPLIHRDVKTSNILLNQKLEAKISDFGLSKAFQDDLCTHVSTAVAGTPGYLDPEYQLTYQLNEKSDVYSFGVVILEVLTAQPPIINTPAYIHVSKWVQQRLEQGGLDMVIDVKLHGKYDAICAMKIVDLALWCTMQTSVQRPDMSYVVSKLKECKEIGMDNKNKTGSSGGSSSSQIARTQSGDLISSDILSGR